jgi:hypothetical protein
MASSMLLSEPDHRIPRISETRCILNWDWVALPSPQIMVSALLTCISRQRNTHSGIQTAFFYSPVWRMKGARKRSAYQAVSACGRTACETITNFGPCNTVGVPDWSITKTVGLRGTGYQDYHAALDLPKQQVLSMDGETHLLSIRATRLDDIVEVCETKRELRDSMCSSTLWGLITRLGPSYAPTPALGQSREEAVWRTLITNRAGSTKPKYPAAPDLLVRSFRAWVLWRYVTASGEPQTYPTPASTPSLLPTQTDIQIARERTKVDASYHSYLAHESSHYDLHFSHAMLLRPFRTRNGYFGIGTQSLREGDSVWIVPGCPVPLILRRVESGVRYRLVGGSYVHGVMDGEFLQGKDVDFEMVDLE